MRPNEPDCVADTEPLRRLGFKAKYSWQDGIIKMLKEDGRI